MNKQETELKRVSERLGELFDLYPVELEESKDVTVAMCESLAKMFADTEYRKFLENSVKFANQNLIRSTTPEQMLFYKSRMETLMQILVKGKKHFIYFEMLQRKVEKKPLPQLTSK